MLRMDETAAASIQDRRKGDLGQVLGSRLTQHRKSRGWRQRELASRSRIDPGRLSKLVRGVNRVSVDELIRLSQALGVSLDELVFGTATSLEGRWQRLLEELKSAGGPPALDFTSRWLQALVVTFRTAGQATEEGHGIR